MRPTGQLKNYLMTPLPDVNLSIDQTRFLVLDFETTGLNVDQDHIISVGFTEIAERRIQLKRNQHHLIRTSQALASDSVSIHQITDDQLSDGMDIRSMMDLLLVHMAGKVVIAHHQQIEYQFIQHLSQKLYGHPLPMLMADTLQIEKHRLMRLNLPISVNQLRLFNLRVSYHLPRYHAHNALEDAVATAELFLAQISHRQANGYPLKLKNILS